jgi:hypothetical protein
VVDKRQLSGGYFDRSFLALEARPRLIVPSHHPACGERVLCLRLLGSATQSRPSRPPSRISPLAPDEASMQCCRRCCGPAELMLYRGPRRATDQVLLAARRTPEWIR